MTLTQPGPNGSRLGPRVHLTEHGGYWVWFEDGFWVTNAPGLDGGQWHAAQDVKAAIDCNAADLEGRE